ncbi:bZIP transcription factor 27-like isoform X1 [Zingiber officinale]|uniref:bZIP transcription factor 27-like isoform X1 n=1 Tax=Zingiber officinale TaxID=94328 RepID=UPI001C4CEAA9|nr:bZIP transcription factor 27-like isoform X1 [Zingiber officinale]
MEEVWEGISLSSLHQDKPSTPSSLSVTAAAAPSSLTSVGGMVLQDFLTRGSPKVGRDGEGHRKPSKEPPEPKQQTRGVERQRKRMMHNRESASRSRARKRAYMDELEKEVGRLRSENRALRAQNEKLQKAVEDQLCVATKRTLQRTLTAPF